MTCQLSREAPPIFPTGGASLATRHGRNRPRTACTAPHGPAKTGAPIERSTAYRKGPDSQRDWARAGAKPCANVLTAGLGNARLGDSRPLEPLVSLGPKPLRGNGPTDSDPLHFSSSTDPTTNYGDRYGTVSYARAREGWALPVGGGLIS